MPPPSCPTTATSSTRKRWKYGRSWSLPGFWPPVFCIQIDRKCHPVKDCNNIGIESWSECLRGDWLRPGEQHHAGGRGGRRHHWHSRELWGRQGGPRSIWRGEIVNKRQINFIQTLQVLSFFLSPLIFTTRWHGSRLWESYSPISTLTMHTALQVFWYLGICASIIMKTFWW